MSVKEEKGIKYDHKGQTFYFCSNLCKSLFEGNPEKYSELIGASVASGMAAERSIAYCNYDMDVAKMLISGVDLWLNTPRRPMEASGTSGMKAVHNGIPNLSVLDGWWVEGHIEGFTGWAIGSKSVEPESGDGEAREIYDKLEQIILPMYYKEREKWLDIMRHSIAFNASFFNTQRMVQQYVLNAYLR